MTCAGWQCLMLPKCYTTDNTTDTTLHKMLLFLCSWRSATARLCATAHALQTAAGQGRRRCCNNAETMPERCWNNAGTMMWERCWNDAGTMLERGWNDAGSILVRCRNDAGTMLERCFSCHLKEWIIMVTWFSLPQVRTLWCLFS